MVAEQTGTPAEEILHQEIWMTKSTVQREKGEETFYSTCGVLLP